jgi:diguanylate cyclase (GGDEF)-like protein
MDNNDNMDPFEKTVVDPLKVRDKSGQRISEHQYSLIFTVMSGNETDFGKVFTFTEDRILMGRDKENNVALDDPKVSKIHCEINLLYTDVLEQIIIKDLDSTNGTYVNGILISQNILKSGDKIEIGETVLRFSYNDEIEEQYHAKLFTFASTDSLTGMYNKRYILNEMENQMKIVKRSQRLFSIVMLDLDDFKKINDTHGHLAGDEYLRKIAQTITRSLREQDTASRFGGEEFLILLPETTLEGAYKLAERIRQKIEKMKLDFQGNSIHSTISAGVSQFDSDFSDAESFIRSADIALYRSKNEGKNRVVIAEKKNKW